MSFPCPDCGKPTGVIDSRARCDSNGPMIARRRKCPNGHRFTTYELTATTKRGRRGKRAHIDDVDAVKAAGETIAAAAIKSIRDRLADIEERRLVDQAVHGNPHDAGAR